MSATKISKNTASVLNCYIFNCILNILNSKRLHPATLLKGDSGTGVFLWAFWIFFRPNDCFWKGNCQNDHGMNEI